MYTAGAKQRGGEREWEGFIYERRKGREEEYREMDGNNRRMKESYCYSMRRRGRQR